ncbi:uncharacterized protein L969DRAFT_92335 [Mixia osmundae IAM 14324]|uniref:LysM domain-containing protein n=1 Tax=Mixia osmundae (strain CBS 9802 / IAM 14324 / JCM 22182 / KY 12970) TaxID=764103 RepID=G7DT99_MIXOS|nr:uncharacterized protein L969DRAFT_92335 [Mixia osmundae IAM 14324]KEI42916.1 hypothetical protein L969DRAFT_92335 [Mixia osmundae IAM 14324]GAA93746.1 hypothetical protein E5Q_00392 [Mixia osmundae IAM 14324]
MESHHAATRTQMTTLCLACASEPLPSKSKEGLDEKSGSQDERTYRTPCCARPICATCLHKRPRLGEYCLYCQRSIDIVSRPPPAYDPLAANSGAFSIGDDEDDDHHGSLQHELAEPDAKGSPPAYLADASLADLPAEKPSERETALHYIRPEDTLIGISFRYGVEPRALATLNRLPLSILTTSPQLLHTRSFLILPGHAKPSESPQPLYTPEQERRRLLIRRFMLAVKCPEQGVAESYIKQIEDARRKEYALLATESGQAAGLRTGGELEEAVEAYTQDLQWEEEQSKGKGKYTGSRIRSVGELAFNQTLLSRARS